MPARNAAISSRVTVENPRPRKYASAAERQKALRERFPTLCVRVEQKQADFVKRIADEIGRTQQDVHLAMVKYALSRPNNQWLTQGLEGFKPLPQFQEGVMTLWRFNKVTGYWIPERKVTAETKEQWLEIFQEDNPDDTFVVSERKPRNAPVKENPMKRKPTPAQIAARERFAEMARSGAFKSKRNPAKKTVSQKISQLTREGYPQKQAVAIALSEERSGKVKRNPAQSMQTFEIIDTTTGESEGFYKAADAQLAFEVWARSNGYKSFSEMKQKEKFGARGRFLAVESQQRKTNPRAANPIILVSDKAIKTRRKSNPAGRPYTLKQLIRKDFKPGMTVYQVQYRQPGMQSFEPWSTVMDLEVAKDTARRLADGYRDLGWTWKVESIEVQSE